MPKGKTKPPKPTPKAPPLSSHTCDVCHRVITRGRYAENKTYTVGKKQVCLACIQSGRYTEKPSHATRRGNQLMQVTAPFRGADKIIKNGKVVMTSKNLAVINRYIQNEASPKLIKVKGSHLHITFNDGATLDTDFESPSLLKDYVARKRNFQGVPKLIDGKRVWTRKELDL